VTIPKTKQDFLERQAKGEFGNTFRIYGPGEWVGLDDWATIRSRVRDSPHFVPLVQGREVMQKLLDLYKAGAKFDELYVQEVPPPTIERVLNFEAGLGADGRLFCRYGEPGTTLNLRHDLEQNGTEVAGLAAALVLRRYLGEECDVLLDLVYDYPGAVVEATMWTRALGTLNRPLLIWEVRGY
jgi:hypothetical protein